MYLIFSLLKLFNTCVLLSLMIMANLLQSTMSLKGNWFKFEFTIAGEQTNYNRDDKSTIISFLDFQINTPITIEMINLKLTNFDFQINVLGMHVERIASATQVVLRDP